jgi:D-alanine-D-alanine ligase
MKTIVAVLAGGDSAERKISLESGQAVAEALAKKGFQVMRFDPKKDLVKFIQAKNKIDVVFPALHGRGGEDGTLQGLLDFLNIPYVGSGMHGMLNSFDKVIAKKIYRSVRLPVARDFVAKQNSTNSEKKIISHVGLPCFVKPAKEGSSFGASIVRKKSELKSALNKTWKFGSALVEEYLQGTELSAGVLEDSSGNLQALPVIEICPRKTFFDLQAKYDPELCTEIIPARISASLTKKIQTLAKKAHQALCLRHLSRTDFILVKNKPYLLETNTLPGFTKNSLYPKEAVAAGIEFPDLVEHLIHLALSDK